MDFDFDPQAPLEDLGVESVALDTDAADFDLFRAAALLGRLETSDPFWPAVDEAVSCLSEAVRERAAQRPSWPGPLTALIEVLFIEAEFCGATDDYDAPHNSFLHRVLERRRGLPIALGVLTCEVAKRAGIEAFGIAFPGHFLVGINRCSREDPTDLIVIDPFARGRPLGPEDLQHRLAQLTPPLQLGPEHIMAAPPQHILTRMLENLRRSYARRNETEQVERVLSRMLILRPLDPDLWMARAEARRLLLRPQGARDDIGRALALPVAEAARERAGQLLRQLADDAHWCH